MNKGRDTTKAFFRKQITAPVVSHPKPFEKQSTEGETPLKHCSKTTNRPNGVSPQTIREKAKGETPLGHFSKTENRPSGVSPQTIRETVNRGWDTTGAFFENRKLFQWCLTPNHSRNSQQRVRHHWSIVRKQLIAPMVSHPKPPLYSTYVFNSWVWLHVGTSVVGIPCNEVSWSYRAGKLGLGWILLSDRAPSFPPEGVWSSIPSVTPCWLKSGSPCN